MDQELYLVFGGRLCDPEGDAFEAPSALDVRGIFPSYAATLAAWRSASQASVDDAYLRHLIIRLR
ncbi:MAG: DUF4170 domain-containing protein [Alphaproteobacteria bacterium]|nr:DUF4170 domain-containing protein [Alphaproteobacteria bacterium]